MLRTINMKILLVLGLVLISGNIFSREFNMISNVESKISIETYQKMGIKQGWIHCPFSVKLDSSGNPVWSNQKDFKRIQAVYKKFENSGILIFLVVGIWRNAFKGESDIKQKSFYGKKWAFGSFFRKYGND